MSFRIRAAFFYHIYYLLFIRQGRRGMLKKGNSRSYPIIIVLFTIFIIPIKGNAQIKENDVSKKGQIVKKTTSQQKIIKKITKSKSRLSNSANFSNRIKDLEKRLLLSKTELLKIKKTEAKKARVINKLKTEINKLKLNSVKLPIKIKALEERLLLSKKELLKIKKTKGELEKADASKKYKALVDCYRTALISWDDINRREGLTEQEHSVIRIELRRSISSCPPI